MRVFSGFVDIGVISMTTMGLNFYRLWLVPASQPTLQHNCFVCGKLSGILEHISR